MEAQDRLGHPGRGTADPIGDHLGHPAQGQLEVDRSGFVQGQVRCGTQHRTQPIGFRRGDHPGLDTGLLQQVPQHRLEAGLARGDHDLQPRTTPLQFRCRLGQGRQQIPQFLLTRSGEQQQQTLPRLQPQRRPGLIAAGLLGQGVDQGMPHPGDIGPAGAIKPRLLRKDRQDPIREADQPGGAAFAHAEGPLLGGDVIEDRRAGQTTLDLHAQVDVGPHVIDEHDAIGGGLAQPLIDPALDLQGGPDQGQGLPEANGPHCRGVGQQGGPGLTHPLTAEGNHLELQAAGLGFIVQGLDQQPPLQVTGDFSGADQQSPHERPAGRGPRRPGPIDASRKLTRVSAGGSRVCSRTPLIASAKTTSPR